MALTVKCVKSNKVWESIESKKYKIDLKHDLIDRINEIVDPIHTLLPCITNESYLASILLINPCLKNINTDSFLKSNLSDQVF